jgi:CARDB protein
MKNQKIMSQKFILKHLFPLSLILVLCLFIFTKEIWASDKKVSSIQIIKITVGEDRIETGRNQLIEVLIKNSSRKTIDAFLKLSLVLPNHNIISFGNRRMSLKQRSETRVLIPYPIDKSRGGDYTVGAKILSKSGKLITQNSESLQRFFFAVDPTRKNLQSSRKNKTKLNGKTGTAKKEKPAIVEPSALFDPPDLLIEEVIILHNNSIIRGETSHVRLIVSNLGGDIAMNVKYTVSWYFAPRKNRKIESFSGYIKVIAPGERKYVEIPVTIPQDEQKGEYFIYAAADESNQIKELSDKNNHAVSKKPIIFSDIALVFPDNQHAFAEDGLFKFQWRSKKFNHFKVQVSTDQLFADKEETFELPKGNNEEGWESSTELKPLSGEMPAMALALMESNDTDFLYWRVKAKDSEGSTAESTVRKFYIRFKADL